MVSLAALNEVRVNVQKLLIAAMSCYCVVSLQVKIRPMMYVALTYDHRLIDGREAVTFLRKIKAIVEDPRAMLVDV